MKSFVKISKYAGMREDLVQAGGGNSAFKLQNDRMVRFIPKYFIWGLQF